MKLRRRPPIIEKNGKELQILCPFCKPAHSITTEKGACNTYLQLTAVQEIYKGRHITCALCGESGGTLVKIGDIYKHDHNCSPGKTLFTETPEYSLSAALAWALPRFIRIRLVKLIKKSPQKITKMDKDGNYTGELLGFCWKKI